MCRSLAEGGQRCYSHTRENLDTARQVLTESPTPVAMERYIDAQVHHASTERGRAELVAERDQAREQVNILLDHSLTGVIERGDTLRERNAALRQVERDRLAAVARANAARAAAGQRRVFDAKETIAIARKGLKQKWPGVNFSLRMARGTGYGYMDLSWEDGPTDREVREYTSQFQNEHFDGMTDSHVHTGPRRMTLPGESEETEVEFRARGILTQRRMGERGQQAVIEIINGVSPGAAVARNREWRDGRTMRTTRDFENTRLPQQVVNNLVREGRSPYPDVPSVANAIHDRLTFHPDGTYTRREGY